MEAKELIEVTPVIRRAVVSVYDDGRPGDGRWVVFQDAEGNVTSSMKSGADGKASGDVSAGLISTS